MTKEEFIKQYCEKSKITVEKFEKKLVALPCKCNGWAAVCNEQKSINIHFELYGP